MVTGCFFLDEEEGGQGARENKKIMHNELQILLSRLKQKTLIIKFLTYFVIIIYFLKIKSLERQKGSKQDGDGGGKPNSPLACERPYVIGETGPTLDRSNNKGTTRYYQTLINEHVNLLVINRGSGLPYTVFLNDNHFLPICFIFQTIN